MINSDMDAWALNMANPVAWTHVSASGTPPPPRRFFAAAYDVLRNRILIFGGGPYTGLFSDVWALSLSGPAQWEQLSASGVGPAPRWAPSAVYDSGHDRLIITCGSTSGGYDTMNDVWALSLSGTPTWSQLLPGGTLPPVRMMAAAIYDPNHDAVLLYGGASPGALGDLWKLALGPTVQWTDVTPSGPSPSPRWSLAAIYRSAGSPQLVIFGGWNGVYNNDVWGIDIAVGEGPPQITYLSPAGGRVGDQVTIGGSRLANPIDVRFHDVSAAVLGSSLNQIVAVVPAGATTGPVTVVTAQGSTQSTNAFYVGETPVVDVAIPGAGKVGTRVELQGRHFLDATKVSFGGTGPAPFSVVADTVIVATIDTLATSGYVRVTTPAATGISTFVFTVLPDDPPPRLQAVRDVKGDQGGKVLVTWLASDFDQPRYHAITGYRVWRRAPVQPEAAREGEPADGLMRTQTIRPDGSAEFAFWESLVQLPAAYLPGYAYVAATLRDSMASDNPYTAFFVQALTADPFKFYSSSIDSGYSVDNLSPPMPAPFNAVYAANSVGLHWTPSTAPDFREFRLYRGLVPDFGPGPATLILATRDTGYVDPSHAPSCYKLAAVDVHGNLSRYALVTPNGPVATLAALVGVDAAPDRIRLTWYAAGNSGLVATLYRRTAGTDWDARAVVTADGTGYLRYEDDAVTSGTRYGYRLGVMDAGVEIFLGEAWATAEPLLFALEGARPNPAAAGELTVLFSLSSAGSGRLDLIDIGGRRMVAREVGSLGPGSHAVNLSERGRIPPGIYLVRLTQGARSLTRRVAVLP
jgi:hypothetical protein